MGLSNSSFKKKKWGMKTWSLWVLIPSLYKLTCFLDDTDPKPFHNCRRFWSKLIKPFNISKISSQLHGDLKEATRRRWVSLPFLLAFYLFDVGSPHLITKTSQQYTNCDAGLKPFSPMLAYNSTNFNPFSSGLHSNKQRSQPLFKLKHISPLQNASKTWGGWGCKNI